ncbi:MAG TPA: hypothetical protein VGI76_04440 [Solirubrobacteraceae bacterium]
MRVTRIDAVLGVAAVFTVCAPILLTRSGFAKDFTNSLWMAWVAGKALVQAGHPGFFVNTTTLGVFYPLFAFYGGPLYAYTGAASELLGGHAEIAFICATMLAILGVYGGILWLGREFGLRGLAAHAPALAALTSAYYMTNLYGRGDWTEFMVTSSLAPLAASGVYLARTGRWHPLPMAIFIASVVLLTAGHNITLLWGTTLGVATLLLVWIAQGASRSLPFGRLAVLGGLGLIGALINAWYLIPDIAYASKVAVAHSQPTSTSIWTTMKGFNLPDVVLYPFRRVPSESTTPALYVQAPDWFLAWGLAAAALLLWRPAVGGALRRVWVCVGMLIVLIFGMMFVRQFWQFVHYPFNEIQAPYRLGTYLFYAVAGLVLIAALALQRAEACGCSKVVLGGLRIGLVGAVAMSLALCLWQLWVPHTRSGGSYANRSAALASATTMPTSWYTVGDYVDWQARTVAVPANRTLFLPPSAVQGDRFDALMNVPPGSQPIQTNIAGGSYLVHIAGLQLVGRNSEDLAIVKRIDGGSGPVRVVVETAHGAPIEAGRVISALALLVTIIILGCAAMRPVWVRRRSAAPLGYPTE